MIFQAAMRRNATKLEGERSSSLGLARGRLVLISGFFVMAYMVLAVRAFDLTVIQGELGHDRAESVSEISSAKKARGVADNALRADIVDRNGVLLATTLETASLYADPRYISDPQAAAQGLVEIFPQLSFGDVLQKLQSEKRFVWVKRGITPEEEYRVLEIGEPGLSFRRENKRIYPHGNLAAHMLGYVDIDGRGQAGIERSFNKYLGYGDPLSMTLDVRLQHVLHREVSKTIEEFSALGGSGVIMDVTSGEILAGVSLPDFDPHKAGKAKSSAIFNGLTLGVYELGSVFKIFSTAALFETLNVPMNTTFDASEPIKHGRFTIRDYHAEDRILTVPEVFMYSSNIGSAMMGEAVGTEALRDFYRDLGLLDTLDFEIKEVTKPIVPNPWGEIHTLTASYGHGVATTPLQLTAAVSSIVNGGYAIKPTLVRSNKPQKAGSDVRVVSEETAHRMRQLLRLVVQEGTGKNADVPGYNVGGKTGTAEKPGKTKKGYDRKRLISSFVGVFPIDAPKYAVFVVIDEPKGTKKSYGYATAGWTAAPAVSRVISSMVSVLGLQPTQKIASAPAFGDELKQYISVKKKR